MIFQKTRRCLSFKDNKIDSFKTNLLSGLNRLQEIDLSSNLLYKFPKNLSRSLKTLNLGYNRITNLSRSDFVGLENVDKLRLERNKIAEIPDSLFLHLKSLKHLILSKNNIEKIHTHALKGLKNLILFDARNNDLTSITPGLFDYFEIDKVDLLFSFNSIMEVPNGLFTKNSKFQTFELKGNKISKIADKAFQNTEFKGLILMNNKLNRIPITSFINMTSSVLNLNENPVDCGCDLYKLFKVVRSSNISGTCSSPPKYFGQNIDNVTNTQNILCTVCDFNPVWHNNGSCIPINETVYNCDCSELYKDGKCELGKKICDGAKPCRNNATCVSFNETSYFCNCTDQFEGINCETKRKPCQVNPCLNKGKCILLDDTNYECKCRISYNGQHCEKFDNNRAKNLVWILFGISFAIASTMVVILLMSCRRQRTHEIRHLQSDIYEAV